jgi:hypothetical protein
MAGNLEVMLLWMSAERDRDGELLMGLGLDARRGGKKVRGTRTTKVRLTDATGNHAESNGDPNEPLIFSETAWKICVSTLRTDEYPFLENEGEAFGPVSMPGTGKAMPLPPQTSSEEKARGLLLTAVVGPGRYVLKNGAFVEVGKPLDGAEAAAFIATPDAGTMRCNLPKPALIQLFDQPTRDRFDSARNRTGEPEMVWRFRWNSEGYGLKQNFNVMFSSSYNAPYDADVYELPESDERGNDITPPPPGTPITIQKIPVVIETVEFLVAPPPKPAALKGK